jgi:DNA repair exonuclease SbcCD ATPase subunit
MEIVLTGLLCLIIGVVGAYAFAKSRYSEKQKAQEEKIAQAHGELAKVQGQIEQLNIDKDQLSTTTSKQAESISELKEKNAALEERNESLKTSKDEAVGVYKSKNLELESKIDTLRNEKEKLSKKVNSFEDSEDQRKKDYDEKLNRLNVAYEQREQEKEKERIEKEEAEAERLKAFKETWARHELNIEEKMQLICQRQGIEYVPKEKFPHKGKPDNAVKICGEYVVFDSKSPDGEELRNFPAYIKGQAEAAKNTPNMKELKTTYSWWSQQMRST